MSAVPLTAPAAARPRLTPWLLRLHRPALYVWTALVLLTAAALLWLHGPLTDAAAAAWDQYDACEWSAHCSYDQPAILRYKDVANYTTLAVTAVPFLVAAWAGAALFGREMESGTARLAWSQGVTPARWLTTRLALPAALITAGTSLLVLLHRTAWTAGEGRIDTAKPWYDTLTLHANGPTTVALALTGLAGGALAGLTLRRTLPALCVSLLVVACARGLADLAMPHLWPAVTRVTDLRQAPAGPGLPVDHGLVTATGRHIADPGCGTTLAPECRALYERLDATSFYTKYHPASHYWPLQLTTTLALLTLTALLTAIGYVTLRRTTGGRRRGAAV
ncbi:ABC transporter permease [Streptomyces griseosporeus]|uniref:ABC transporter permease n=1 Tax=Streptomyces griseosporeus TaxID=1910 RepID=UPI0036B24C74